MNAPVRPAKPTIDELRQVTQPDSILARQNAEHWLNNVYLRKLSPYLTQQLLKTSISANGVTVLMIAIGVLCASALLLPGFWPALLAAFLAQFQMLWDCSDGEVARWKNQFSARGFFLDKVAHYSVEGLIPLALGIRAAGGLSVFSGDQASWWPYLGALLAVVVLWNKALNDSVHVARAASGLDRLADVRSVSAPSNKFLGTVKSVVRYFPFQRIFHSIEMTALILVASMFDLVNGTLSTTRNLLIGMLILSVITLIGHFASILSSSRLK